MEPRVSDVAAQHSKRSDRENFYLTALVKHTRAPARVYSMQRGWIFVGQ